NFVGFSAMTIRNWIFAGLSFLGNFDWNQSDQQLQAQLQSRNVTVAGAWGGAIGSGIGTLTGMAIGAGLALTMPIVGGTALAATIAFKVGEEGWDEAWSNIKNAMNQTARALTAYGVTYSYIWLRRAIKNLPESFLARLFGRQQARWIREQWGNAGGPSVTYAAWQDQQIENISSNQAVQAFFEELIEESWDSFVESGFIIAQEIDDAFTQAKINKQAQLGKERSVELVPDQRVEEEVLTFQNVPQKLLQPIVEQTINQHRLIHDRNVGLLFGMPTEELIKAKPRTLTLVIDLYSKKHPPFFNRQDDDFVWATITIPDLKRTKADWTTIKAAVGNANGYLWGRFCARAMLDNGRTMKVYGGSDEEARDRLTALLQLTEAEMLSITVAEEMREGERRTNARLYKRTTRIYPGYFTIINRVQMLDRREGQPSLTGNYRDIKIKIPLWTEQKPGNADRQIQQLLQLNRPQHYSAQTS
ncbi:MAG TPA: hypothetical protein V6C65_04685, partial [Allocoleopsis sp.]